MTNLDPDLLRRVLSHIQNQRKHLQPNFSDEEHVARYHEQLDRLQQAGCDIREFRIDPERDMYRYCWSTNSVTGESQYADTLSVSPGVLEYKMDALLGYFTLKKSGTEIEYRGPFLS